MNNWHKCMQAGARWALAGALAAVLMAGCEDAPEASADKEARMEYERAFRDQFGSIDPSQDFNMARPATLKVQTDGMESTESAGRRLRVYTADPIYSAARCRLLADYAVTGPQAELTFDLPEGLSAIFVGLDEADGRRSLRRVEVADGTMTVDLAHPTRTAPTTDGPEATRAEGGGDFDYASVREAFDGLGYVIAYEDMGTVGDFDFNDLVVRVTHVAGQADVSVELLAAGGKLPITLSYNGQPIAFDGQTEVHAAFGVATTTPVNVDGRPRSALTVPTTTMTFAHPEAITTLISDFASLFTVSVTRADGTVTEMAPFSGSAGLGKSPQAVVVADPDWEWPTEGQSILTRYPDFASWVTDGPDVSWYAPCYLRRALVAGHEYVDMGLSVMWATCNVGASEPQEAGGFFHWGGTTPTVIRTMASLPPSIGGDNVILDATEDAASVQWGGTWRMPTRDEFEQLCGLEWTATTLGGVTGYNIRSHTTGNSIFLPSAGAYEITTVTGKPHYWTSEAKKVNDTSFFPYRMWIDYDDHITIGTVTSSGHCLPVRAVCPVP